VDFIVLVLQCDECVIIFLVETLDRSCAFVIDSKKHDALIVSVEFLITHFDYRAILALVKTI
jgi:hypothetical protein